MSQQLKNKIEASGKSISALLKDQKFTIDDFQREYRWQEKHLKLLIEDLTSTFLKSYDPSHKRSEVANYLSYYLGPVVFSIDPTNAKKSIIDGQQRITSITLFLIYLDQLQKNSQIKVNISELVFSEKYGVKSFNMTDEDREPCLKGLFETGLYTPTASDSETIVNIVDRYNDIEDAFPVELTKEALPYFIDWFVQNVVIVEIIAYSEDNAYLIFETMNDRGLNLTPTEMLKGCVLSNIKDKNQRNEINALWKQEIQKLHEYDEDADQIFFQAWFRGKYAVSIRPGKVDSEDKDFELIGSRFHNWFKENHKTIFNLNSPDDFYEFFKNQFPFYVKWFINIRKAEMDINTNMPHVYYVSNWGVAVSLQSPLLLASVNFKDNDKDIEKKIDFVSHYIETFTVRRAVNYRKFGQTSIKYTMFNLIKLIRNNDLNSLSTNLKNEVAKIPEKWDTITDFGLHGQNGKFVKHLLCRITSHLDNLVGRSTDFKQYLHPSGKQFEIEHIWANKYAEHTAEFDQITEFQEWRNSIGGLILLPQGTNQSFSSDKYKDKLEHYLKENVYAQTLHPNNYVKNPNFLNSPIIQGLKFSAHPEFLKKDNAERTELVKRICENIWSEEYFK